MYICMYPCMHVNLYILFALFAPLILFLCSFAASQPLANTLLTSSLKSYLVEMVNHIKHQRDSSTTAVAAVAAVSARAATKKSTLIASRAAKTILLHRALFFTNARQQNTYM